MTEDSLANDRKFQEWKACRDTIAAFDKIQLDLRKYGFSLITILLGANGVIFGETRLSLLSVLGIYLTILVLIVGLFRLDRVYHVFIRSTVMRAMQLETDMHMRLSIEISQWSERVRTDTWGNFLYVCLTIAAAVIALAGVDTKDADKGTAYILIGVIWIGSLLLVARLHHRTEPLKKEFDDMLVDLRGQPK